MNRLSHASLEQAAQWYVQLHDEQVADHERLRWQAWLAQSAEHQEAWRYVERVGQRFAPLQGENEAHAVSHTLRSSRTSISRRQSLKGLLILAATGLSGWVAWRSTPLPDAVERLSADLSTDTGETREATLSDGSRIWLNALSALNVRFDTTQRLLQLRVGEVLIETAKDAGRAFLVDTAHGRMQALGTRFSVRQDDRQTWLNVYEGAVQVRNRRDQVEVVAAGRQLVFSADHLGDATPANPSREAWRQGLLLADNLPLGELIEELSHYRPGHLHCDPAVAALPVMGSFPLRDSDQALRLLEAALPIRVNKTLGWWVNVGPKG
ncbi:FecR domain-containing protein [Pseudomonas sp. B2M1-30]|uniref:FecR domain-containing protein n=1 Tax=Pseudomonas TaxID=286 RepID=UPI0021C73654|nr:MULTISPECIES: FecR domain-containing protein [Pseudomonas]MCU0120024.1 FecR domain-containing protein [Pseudomonas sp. B2M1-30]MCU7262035.1 FecR domain-containing protein [Pseudomonas koreensis]